MPSSSRARSSLPLAGQSRHLLPLRPMILLILPHFRPVPYILRNTLRTPRPHPHGQYDQAAPEKHAPQHADPEHDRLPEDVEDFEADEDDDDEQGDSGQVGFSGDLVDEEESVGASGGEERPGLSGVGRVGLVGRVVVTEELRGPVFA